MRDLSPLERWLFDWLGRRSSFILASLPIAVFIGLGLLGILAASIIARRSPIGDQYEEWLIAVHVVSAMALYAVAGYAVAAIFVRSQRFKLLELHQTMRDIQAMSWREFEDLIAANYAARDYAVEPVGGEGPDGGVDLIVRKGGHTWLVQCKHWRSQWVDERPLRELLGVVTARGATGGVFVSCGVFGDKALSFAKSNEKLELIGGEQLRELIANATRTANVGAKCPSCGSSMREKRGRFGPFLGCSNFPACRGWLRMPLDAMPTE
jgi:restriction system protein